MYSMKEMARTTLCFIIFVTIYSFTGCACERRLREYRNCSQIEPAVLGGRSDLSYNTTNDKNRTCIWNILVEKPLKLTLNIVQIRITPQDAKSGKCFLNKRLEIYEKEETEGEIYTICGDSVTTLPQRSFIFKRNIEIRFSVEPNNTGENIGFHIEYYLIEDKDFTAPEKLTDLTWLFLILIAIVAFVIVIIIIFWSNITQIKFCSRSDSDSDSVFERGPSYQNYPEPANNTRVSYVRSSMKSRSPNRRIRRNRSESSITRNRPASFTTRQNSDDNSPCARDSTARPKSGFPLTSFDESWSFSEQLSPSPHEETYFNFYSTRRARVLQVPGQLSPSIKQNSELGGCMSEESLQRRSFYYLNQDKEQDGKMLRRGGSEIRRIWRSTDSITNSPCHSFSERSPDSKSNADGHFSDTSPKSASLQIKNNYQNIGGESSQSENHKQNSVANGSAVTSPGHVEQEELSTPRKLFRYHSADDALEEIMENS